MNKKDFLDYIIPKVEPYFLKYGFVYRKSKSGFVKKIDNGWVKIDFSFYDFAMTYNMNLGFELRKNKVQELFIRYVDINPSDGKNLPTIVFSLTGLVKNEFTSFRYTNEKELDSIIIGKIIPFLDVQLILLIERYNELKNIYQLFTDSNEYLNEQIAPNYDNYLTALIIGWLLFPDNFDDVVASIDDLFLKLKNKWPNSLSAEQYEDSFNKIVADLKSKIEK
ncbi:hypothetical protein PQ469_23505 [Mucilaginibacter sp. KACC 22773]|uniref:hypothetical protein n=1 Tax=Mucilaginibacter sp. KACC 22773 TaxID=3025671 RepID=UPI0023667E83|nr:hypothetical protein [Mucilaginibacter sp. KACC 22773]WDF76854.1 hypothetical protein PQ469_23505 [Mucilaginibacter sp. KACC 22773]